jgi:hypothetical protein
MVQGLIFCQFDEYAAGCAGVDERDSFALGSQARGLVDQPNPEGPAARQYGIEVINGKTDVMEPWTTLLEEPANRSIGGKRFEQLDERITGRDGGDRRPVRVIERDLGEPQHVTIERQRIGKPTYGYADMRDTRPRSGR